MVVGRDKNIQKCMSKRLNFNKPKVNVRISILNISSVIKHTLFKYLNKYIQMSNELLVSNCSIKLLKLFLLYLKIILK